MDGLKANFEMLKDNGYQLKLQLNHITHYPIIMDNSSMIKVIIKAITNIRTTITTSTATIINIRTTITISTATNRWVINRCLKEPGNNLLELIITIMECFKLNLKMLKDNGFMLKFNVNLIKD
jgi:hypothetical protein